MQPCLLYPILFCILLLAEVLYFRIAEKCRIVDKPNERSSHSGVVLRGGGIVFFVGAWIWGVCFGFEYPWFLLGMTLVAGVSFMDDLHSLPDSVRLLVQFLGAVLAFYQWDMLHLSLWWWVLIGLIVYVGIMDVVNFMDGINGMTGGYGMCVLGTLWLINNRVGFVDPSIIVVTLLAALVFCIFNFRPKGKAKCFAGDVGSIGIAYIILFILTGLIVATGDVTYLLVMVVYGIDACFTIIHRLILHEHIGQAHRKHLYQIMANELKMNHILVAAIYMLLQLAVSLVFIYLIPNTVLAHWSYLIGVVAVLGVAYVLFMKKYYHLHEEYLASLTK